MARLVEAGCDVRYVAFSIATRSLPEGFPPDTLASEVREATAELGIPAEPLTVHDFDVRTFPERRQDILELLVALWEEWEPDVVFQPSLHDVHQDHRTVAEEGLRAFKRTTILGYEIPWNNFDFEYQWYVALEQKHVERKVAALEQYASQQHRRYANAEYVRNLARMHGVNVNRELRRGLPGVPRRGLSSGSLRPIRIGMVRYSRLPGVADRRLHRPVSRLPGREVDHPVRVRPAGHRPGAFRRGRLELQPGGARPAGVLRPDPHVRRGDDPARLRVVLAAGGRDLVLHAVGRPSTKSAPAARPSPAPARAQPARGVSAARAATAGRRRRSAFQLLLAPRSARARAVRARSDTGRPARAARSSALARTSPATCSNASASSRLSWLRQSRRPGVGGWARLL